MTGSSIKWLQTKSFGQRYSAGWVYELSFCADYCMCFWSQKEGRIKTRACLRTMLMDDIWRWQEAATFSVIKHYTPTVLLHTELLGIGYKARIGH